MSVTSRYAVPNDATVGTSPHRSTAMPATTPPTGNAADEPAITTPHTRARRCSGTRSKMAVSMIGFSEPAQSPLTTTTPTSTGTGTSSATAKKRGHPHTRYATKNVGRRGSRCPIAPNSSAPASAAPLITPATSPSTRGSPSTSRA